MKKSIPSDHVGVFRQGGILFPTQLLGITEQIQSKKGNQL